MLLRRNALLFHARVFFCNGAVGTDNGSEGGEGRQNSPEGGQRGDGLFRGYVADQDILREGTAPEAADGGVKAAAAGAPGSGDFCGGLIRARVQMDAKVNAVDIGGD